MNTEDTKAWIAEGDLKRVESAWLQAVEQNEPAAELSTVLEALVEAGHLDLAETLGWTLVTERAERLPPEEALPFARMVCLALPVSGELREQAAELYRKAFGSHEHFAAILRASGLTAGQSPRRAFRTLDTCLALRPGSYVVNRYENHVFRTESYDPLMDQFTLVGPAGERLHVEPKGLADTYDLVDEKDFRVLCQHRVEELSQLLQSDPAGVLTGLCMVHGGEIDAATLKDTLVPKYISAGEWADWWSKARTAAKRSPNLALTGRSPVVVKYHPQGLTLEQEMAHAAQAARTPLDHLAVLQLYVREAKSRKTRPQAEFAGAILRAVAEQAVAFQKQRPADSLAAALAVSAAEDLGLQKPDVPLPSTQEILAGSADPATVVAELAGTPVWPEALATLAHVPEAARRLEELLRLAPASELDDVAARLTDAGGAETVARVAAEAAAAPLANLELFLWLWKGPAQPPAGIPSKVDLLSRLLKAMQEAESDWQIAPSQRKAILQRCRAALGAGDRAAYRQAVSEMDEAVAGTIKRLIERTHSLAAALYEDLLAILRESFFRLFAKEKVAPWLDEGTIWTTEATLHRRQDELKELQEVKMLQNARAIGAAAEHGDLSENSDWKSALEERDLLRARAAKMVDELGRARPIRRDDVPADSIGVGSKVTLRRLADGTELELSFLGPWDSNPDQGVFSYQTAMALELMGKAVGETVNLKLDGKDGEYRIERLASAVK